MENTITNNKPAAYFAALLYATGQNKASLQTAACAE